MRGQQQAAAAPRGSRRVACALWALAGLWLAGCKSSPAPPPAEPARATPASSTTAETTGGPAPAPASRPTPAAPAATPAHDKDAKTVTFTIVYDNNAYHASSSATAHKPLRTAWGFACWIAAGQTTVLFDTGGDGATLLHNLAALGLDPRAIDAVVLSHAHGDHTGGLEALLGTRARPSVYALAAFPAAFKRSVASRTRLVEVTRPKEIAPGIRTTGEVGTRISEQALAVQTRDGIVVVTGCAHPGVVEMVRRAKLASATAASTGDAVALVLGGFHLGGADRARVEGIIAELRQLGVRRVAPCHCTGDRAREQLAAAFGADCVLAGMGTVLSY